MMNPTKAQREAIESPSPNLVVSASAGSGKTTTMIARIVQILAMGNSRLTDLLVLTFTDESARDMRKKLKIGLEREIAAAKDDKTRARLKSDLLNLPSAAIGTFHSFCANTVRSWFTVAEVSPNFAVADEIETAKIKSEVFAKTVANCYEAAKPAVAMFAASRRLDGLERVIYALHAFLETRGDKEKWLTETALQCYTGDLNTNPAVRALIEHYREAAAWYRAKVIDFNYASPQTDFVIDIADKIAAAALYDDFRALTALPPFPNLKPDKNFADYEDFKRLRTAFKNEVLNKLQSDFAKTKEETAADIAKDRTVASGLILLVRDFMERYGERKRELRKLDFNDLEKYALKVLNDKDALSGVRAGIKYIFVDEGQDTNPVQFEIVGKLRGGDKFFYMVGDVKQSIYAFRGCEPDGFQSMTAEELTKCLRLNKNFRSTDGILDFVNTVFMPLMSDYSEDHKFILDGAPPPSGAVKIDIVTAGEDAAEINTLTAQMELVYRQIKAGGENYGDTAVLAETGTHFEELREYLRARGIPAVIDRTREAGETPEVAVMNNFLFAAANPTNDLPLVLTMKNVFSFTNDELSRIKSGNGKGRFIEFIKKYIAGGNDAKLQNKLQKFTDTLMRYNALIRTSSVAEVLTVFAAEFKFIGNANADAFIAKMKGMNFGGSTARYLYLIEHGLIRIEINAGAADENAVRIMTVHHAKGLEFPNVILFNMGDIWSRQGHRSPISVDKNIGICVMSADTDNFVRTGGVLRAGVDRKLIKSAAAEKTRLLYVALTRAKSQLYIVGTGGEADWLTPKCMLDLILRGVKISPYTINTIDISDIKLSPVIKQTAKTKTAESLPILKDTDGTGLPVKQSVTALSQTEIDFADYTAPFAYKGGGAEYGTDFHKRMQYGSSDADVREAESIVGAFTAGYTVYKEMPFLFMLDGTLVQGIIDLLAVKGDDVIIIDYKTTRAGEAELKKRYAPQLALYAKAAAGRLPKATIRTFIYSTVHKKIIAVS